MQRDPHLTEAMVRAFMFADTSAAAEVEQVGRLMENMFAKAMGIAEPTVRRHWTFARSWLYAELKGQFGN